MLNSINLPQLRNINQQNGPNRQENQNKEFEKEKEKRYNDIYKHESAHYSAGGELVNGGIVIEKDANGVPIGGHVNISVPGVNPKNPKETIRKADIAYRSATAPSDSLSSADLSVAAHSLSVKSQAEALLSKQNSLQAKKQGNNLDYLA